MDLDEWGYTRTDYHWDEELNSIPNEDEIFRALQSMGLDKAPGPDGLPTVFFKAHWDTIRKDFLKMTFQFFTRSKLPHFINDTNLVLIPKSGNPSMVNDYHPIALCNVIYKCISKVIALRLQNVLPHIISPTQTAFVKGQSMKENTSIA